MEKQIEKELMMEKRKISAETRQKILSLWVEVIARTKEEWKFELSRQVTGSEDRQVLPPIMKKLMEEPEIKMETMQELLSIWDRAISRKKGEWERELGRAIGKPNYFQVLDQMLLEIEKDTGQERSSRSELCELIKRIAEALEDSEVHRGG